jgi:arylsulfatase A-like enzyme
MPIMAGKATMTDGGAEPVTRQAVVRHSSGCAVVTRLRRDHAGSLTWRAHDVGMSIPRRQPLPARRVIVVVADGLRPDVIPLLDLPAFGRLARLGTSTLLGRTVSPSVTAAAMSSLLTGVPPAVHGLASSRFRVPRPRGRVDPLPAVLRTAGVRTVAFMAALPWTFRRLGSTLGTRLGFEAVSFAGANAATILQSARRELTARHDGLCVFHWPDADQAGHRHGWPSPPYLRAVRNLDRCLGELDAITGASQDPETVLIVVADHGGGGRVRRDHDSDHPLDRTIPIIIAGGHISQATTLLPGASLLDVPPTILRAFGLPSPESYTGRALHEAFFEQDFVPVVGGNDAQQRAPADNGNWGQSRIHRERSSPELTEVNSTLTPISNSTLTPISTAGAGGVAGWTRES